MLEDVAGGICCAETDEESLTESLLTRESKETSYDFSGVADAEGGVPLMSRLTADASVRQKNIPYSNDAPAASFAAASRTGVFVAVALYERKPQHPSRTGPAASCGLTDICAIVLHGDESAPISAAASGVFSAVGTKKNDVSSRNGPAAFLVCMQSHIAAVLHGVW